MTGDPNLARESQSWGVSPRIAALGAAVAVGFLGWLLLASSAEDRVVAGAGSCVAVAAAVAALRMRARLTADSKGLTIRGPVGRRELGWSQVTAIGAPTRRSSGRGARAALELDLADGALIVLTRFELTTDPADVVSELLRWKLRSADWA